MAFGLTINFICFFWIKKHCAAPFAKRFFLGFLGFLGLLGFLTVAYGSFIEPQIITITQHSITLPATNELRIVVLSDFHVGPYKDAAFVRRVVQRVNMLYPDLILLTGDFIYGKTSQTSDLLPLGDLRASLGIFAVTGNHDAGQSLSFLRQPIKNEDRRAEIMDMFEGMDIPVLHNEHRIVTLPNGSLAIAGITDLWTGEADIERALNGIEPTTPTILLSHNPDVVLHEESHTADLIVSGHAHGGQIRLPFQKMFSIDTKLTKTLQLAITRGVGESLARARLFAWPEILVLDVNSM
ncbi:hypothetical protein A3D11_02290 [Candidatus Peribacteria bacterium RIFCSPHIGHO2_02_FULL_49_16]|nr:MAG: hypothetical protein A2880_03750 [Candidatus Peribacteria bacterium RIFCSPHIGHO2_01_FULL_49_38]OGJ59955.1 MAG: hypothetical protein A3D11_02290 [Candidatus Peribacteria bacterium RIFCSPHIGHO2_02_FULL_49_16]